MKMEKANSQDNLEKEQSQDILQIYTHFKSTVITTESVSSKIAKYINGTEQTTNREKTVFQ